MSITKDGAKTIADKLHATLSPKKNRPHDLYHVRHNGRIIASFGIRRSSKRDKGHGHIPAALHVSPHQADGLVECNVSEQDWLSLMKEKGIIPS